MLCFREYLNSLNEAVVNIPGRGFVLQSTQQRLAGERRRAAAAAATARGAAREPYSVRRSGGEDPFARTEGDTPTGRAAAARVVRPTGQPAANVSQMGFWRRDQQAKDKLEARTTANITRGSQVAVKGLEIFKTALAAYGKKTGRPLSKDPYAVMLDRPGTKGNPSGGLLSRLTLSNPLSDPLLSGVGSILNRRDAANRYAASRPQPQTGPQHTEQERAEIERTRRLNAGEAAQTLGFRTQATDWTGRTTEQSQQAATKADIAADAARRQREADRADPSKRVERRNKFEGELKQRFDKLGDSPSSGYWDERIRGETSRRFALGNAGMPPPGPAPIETARKRMLGPQAMFEEICKKRKKV